MTLIIILGAIAYIGWIVSLTTTIYLRHANQALARTVQHQAAVIGQLEMQAEEDAAVVDRLTRLARQAVR